MNLWKGQIVSVVVFDQFLDKCMKSEGYRGRILSLGDKEKN